MYGSISLRFFCVEDPSRNSFSWQWTEKGGLYDSITGISFLYNELMRHGRPVYYEDVLCMTCNSFWRKGIWIRLHHVRSW